MIKVSFDGSEVVVAIGNAEVRLTPTEAFQLASRLIDQAKRANIMKQADRLKSAPK
jgi:hypothetical protein